MTESPENIRKLENELDKNNSIDFLSKKDMMIQENI